MVKATLIVFVMALVCGFACAGEMGLVSAGDSLVLVTSKSPKGVRL